MGMIGNAPVAGTIGTSNIQDGGVTTADLADGAVTSAKLSANLQGATFGFKNRIINGAMMIDQRNAGASVSVTNTNPYTLDRWQCIASQASSKFTVQQTPSVTETGYAVRVGAGFTNYLATTSSSAYSVLSTDYFALTQRIEGLNVSDLAWGTSSAKTVTLSFWAYSSLTGTFGGAVSNNGGTRSYPFSYSIPTANTWTQISVTIAGDQSGTWLTTNGIGVELRFSLGAGSTYSGTAGSWSGSNYVSTTGATSVVGTSGATFYITGVQLEKGSTATSFDYRPYGAELALCQRYFWKQTGGDGGNNYAAVGSGVYNGTAAARVYIKYPIAMRSAPTISMGGVLTAQAGGFGITTSSINGANSGTNATMVDFAVTGATSGQGAVIYVDYASTSYVQASAEL